MVRLEGEWQRWRYDEAFAKLDFLQDGFDSTRYDWELREAYLKFRLPGDIDLKVGRQILTWGTGDLLFINDLFPKDWNSFLLGRDEDQEFQRQTGSSSRVVTDR